MCFCRKKRKKTDQGQQSLTAITTDAEPDLLTAAQFAHLYLLRSFEQPRINCKVRGMCGVCVISGSLKVPPRPLSAAAGAQEQPAPNKGYRNINCTQGNMTFG